MSRPTRRCVPVKTAEPQAALMPVGWRERLIRQARRLTRAGDAALRSVLVAGATAVIRQVGCDRGAVSP
jgi:transposase